MAKNKPRSFASIAWILCVGMLLLWAAGMGLATLALAGTYQELLMNNYAGKVVSLGNLSDNSVYLEDPDSLEVAIMEVVGDMGSALEGYGISYSTQDLILSGRVPASAAVLVLDREKNAALWSRDALVIHYEREPDRDGEEPERGSAWMDLSNDPELAAAVETFRETKLLQIWRQYKLTVRITGYLDGGQMIPSKMSCTTLNDPYTDHIVLDRIAPAGVEQITVNAYTGRDHCFVEDRQVRYQQKSYANLLEILRDGDSPEHGAVYSLTEMYLFDTAVIGHRVDGRLEADYMVRSVVRCNPLLGAAKTLKDVYIGSFLGAFLIVAVILLIIRKNLTRPLAVLDAHMAGDFLPQLKRTPKWRESLAIEAHFQNWQKERKELLDQQKKLEDTVNRLRQALEYAGKAEENRRRMISALAHELKTPLAVIHSYTEGLQENIADDKRGQYLQTLLEESEQMDALVMEMLDLSRLESGRVVLARDRFCLTELAKEVFGRMEKLAKEKGLQVEYELNRSMEVCADEGRIRQAVRNLASNAVRYTRTGGRIFVKTAVRDGFCVLTVENDAQSFTEEELGLVWESFYRKDPSREGKGTGLGLAIVRNILKLHGGGSFVRNTESGVEFSIRLPQK